MKIKKTEFLEHINIGSLLAHAVLNGINELNSDDMNKVSGMDENGDIDFSLLLNGIEINCINFFNMLETEYTDCVKHTSTKMLNNQLNNLQAKLLDLNKSITDRIDHLKEYVGSDIDKRFPEFNKKYNKLWK